MNYELAKQLKVAGYNQNPLNYQYDMFISKVGMMYPRYLVEGSEFFKKRQRGSEKLIFCPSLEGLIKACGDRFAKIESPLCEENDNQEWTAYATYAEIDGEFGYGRTPEEAVANLWLSLNIKLT